MKSKAFYLLLPYLDTKDAKSLLETGIFGMESLSLKIDLYRKRLEMNDLIGSLLRLVENDPDVYQALLTHPEIRFHFMISYDDGDLCCAYSSFTNYKSDSRQFLRDNGGNPAVIEMLKTEYENCKRIRNIERRVCKKLTAERFCVQVEKFRVSLNRNDLTFLIYRCWQKFMKSCFVDDQKESACIRYLSELIRSLGCQDEPCFSLPGHIKRPADDQGDFENPPKKLKL
jgi:hypothetical protein